MSKAFFIIPGLTHQANEPQYRWLKNHVASMGYQPKLVPITWKRRTMSDYVQEFQTYFDEHRLEENHVLGFSFGAMIAFISAPKTRPEQLYLCSLSPYFSEDLPGLVQKEKRYMGKRRLQDFKHHRSHEIAKNIDCTTVIFCGEQEGSRFPDLKKRCQEVVNLIKTSTFVEPQNAPHQISFPSYVTALKAHIK